MIIIIIIIVILISCQFTMKDGPHNKGKKDDKKPNILYHEIGDPLQVLLLILLLLLLL
jgi:hypothetical protein